MNAQSTGRDYEISQDEVIELADEINTTYASKEDPIIVVKQCDKLSMTYVLISSSHLFLENGIMECNRYLIMCSYS